MRTLVKVKKEDTSPKPTYIQKLPRKKIIQERKKVRQLLRSMLPMGKDERQLQEEQKLFTKPGRLSRQSKMMKTTNMNLPQKPGLISVSPEPSKDVFSSTKISLPAPAGNEGAAELAPSGTHKRSM